MHNYDPRQSFDTTNVKIGQRIKKERSRFGKKEHHVLDKKIG